MHGMSHQDTKILIVLALFALVMGLWFKWQPLQAADQREMVVGRSPLSTPRQRFTRFVIIVALTGATLLVLKYF